MNDHVNEDFKKIVELSKRAHLWKSISQLLEWDQETHMPKDAFQFRSDQIELLSGKIHEEKTNPEFKKALVKLIDLDSGKILAKDLTFAEERCLVRWRRDYLLESKLPEKFVKKFARLTSEAMTIWGEAKREHKFSLFAPYLEQIIELCREKAFYLGYSDHVYDALLDEHDPGRTTKEVEKLFSELARELPPLIKNLRTVKVEDDFLSGDFPKEAQMHLGKKILEILGYDFNRGRLDLSNHPFSTTLHPYDSRITTRMKETTFMEGLSAVIHEAGHSFYEMGMNPQNYGTPMCEPISLSIHESQSRLWETFLGQGEPFWKFFYPFVQKAFKKHFEAVSFRNFYRAINKVTSTPIRVDADEVSYSLHVIIRFELEKELITSKIQVKDLPDAWNFMMEKYLNIAPKNDSEGCLQDIHWSMGAFGYFPTYVLGNLFAASFFDGFTKKEKHWDKEIENGNFAPLKIFLTENIYQHGRVYSGEELLHKITSEKHLSTVPYFSYLKKKYTHLF